MDDDRPREAELIRTVREQLMPPTSVSVIARRAGMSGKRLRELEAGVGQDGKPARAKAETLANVAHVLGITSDQLREAERADAAQILDWMIESRASAEPTIEDLPATSKDVQQAILLTLEEIRSNTGLSRRQRAEMEAEYLEWVRNDLSSRTEQVRRILRIADSNTDLGS